MSLAPDDQRHGTANGYRNLGCRCRPCTDAWAAYHREGRWRRDAPTLYRYAWGNNEKRARLKGRFCFVIARGRMGSVMVLFFDGHREITSQRAVRKVVW